MTRILLACATLFLASAAMAETVTVTGQNGGTLTGTRTCQRAIGQISCNFNAIVTTPGGATGTRTRATLLTQGSLTTTLSGTRAGGRDFGRTTTITR